MMPPPPVFLFDSRVQPLFRPGGMQGGAASLVGSLPLKVRQVVINADRRIHHTLGGGGMEEKDRA